MSTTPFTAKLEDRSARAARKLVPIGFALGIIWLLGFIATLFVVGQLLATMGLVAFLILHFLLAFSTIFGTPPGERRPKGGWTVRNGDGVSYRV